MDAARRAFDVRSAFLLVDSAQRGICLSAAFSLNVREHVGHGTKDGSGAEGCTGGRGLKRIISDIRINRTARLLTLLSWLHFLKLGSDAWHFERLPTLPSSRAFVSP